MLSMGGLGVPFWSMLGQAATTGIDHLAGQALWSESVRMDSQSADGEEGFWLRICRYPGNDTTWTWGHVFTYNGLYAFTDHYQPCSEQRTDLSQNQVTYQSGQGSNQVTLVRNGTQLSPLSCSARARVNMHKRNDAPHGAGNYPVAIDAEFTSLTSYADLLPGRTEVQGRVQATIEVENQRLQFDSLGQFHEQPQERPRWMSPFTYLSVWSEELAATCILTPRSSNGFVFQNGELFLVSEIAIEPPAPSRGLLITLANGRTLEGRTETKHQFAIPVYDNDWNGSRVFASINGTNCAGAVNDYLSRTRE